MLRADAYSFMLTRNIFVKQSAIGLVFWGNKLKIRYTNQDKLENKGKEVESKYTNFNFKKHLIPSTLHSPMVSIS